MKQKHLILSIMILNSMLYSQGTWSDSNISTSTNDVVIVSRNDPNNFMTFHNTTLDEYWKFRITDAGNFNLAFTDNIGSSWPLKISRNAPTDLLCLDANGCIGIATDSPQAKLHVNGSIRSFNGAIELWENDNEQAAVKIEANNTRGGLTVYENGIGKISLHASANSYFNAGNVGIGTTMPQASLHIEKSNASFILGESNDRFLAFNIDVPDQDVMSISVDQSDALVFGEKLNDDDDELENEWMRITNAGNIGIGTTNPGLYKLAVNGKIGAVEIEVKQDIPDYVFEENYNLRSLEEIETYINKERHLPDIPSAKEFENKSVPVGRMQEKHLQKIEELTLYLIEQYKINKEQAKEIEELKIRLDILENSNQ